MRRIAIILCGLIFSGCLFWRFPLFHIVRPEAHQPSIPKDKFDAAEFSELFWKERLIPSLTQAADARTLLTALAADRNAAGEKFGRKVGVSRTRLFVLRGSGKVVSMDKPGVGVVINDEAASPQIVLLTGLLFGNVARDATGLLDASDFPNSQDFNEISTELNRIVEARVITALKDQAKIGRRVQFVGCAEIPDDADATAPLAVIPLEVQFQ